MDSIGKRIKQRREELGLSQADLANKLGEITSAAVSLIEKGDRKPSYNILLKLSEVLGVTTDFLMGKSEESKVEISFRGAEKLSPDQRKEVENYAKFLLEKVKANKGEDSNGT